MDGLFFTEKWVQALLDSPLLTALIEAFPDREDGQNTGIAVRIEVFHGTERAFSCKRLYVSWMSDIKGGDGVVGDVREFAREKAAICARTGMPNHMAIIENRLLPGELQRVGGYFTTYPNNERVIVAASGRDQWDDLRISSVVAGFLYAEYWECLYPRTDLPFRKELTPFT
jgi:hypothetical protein